MYWAYKPVRPIMINCEICRGRWFQYHASRLANQPPGHPNRFGCLGALVARTNDADWRKLKLRPKAFYRDWRANRPAIQTGLDAWMYWAYKPVRPIMINCEICRGRWFQYHASRLANQPPGHPNRFGCLGRIGRIGQAVAERWSNCGRTAVELWSNCGRNCLLAMAELWPHCG